jgi:transposase
MEATGVYHERLAYHLHKLNKVVHVVLPNTSKHYFSSLNIKTKTDEVDAKVLSRFGVERRHREWNPPSKVIMELRNITRYYVQLQEQKTAINNIKHSKEQANEVQAFIKQSNKKLITEIDKQIQLCQRKIKELIESDASLQNKVQKLLTIKGVGLITIATIIAETLGFDQVRNAKQLASFAGYDVVQRESGTSIKGKTRISKKGNRYIRNALYFPAMVSCRFNPEMKRTYLRIIQNKSSKMIGQVAIQRKLLLLIYTLWKNDTEYIQDYKNKVAQEKSQATQDRTETALP